MTNQNPQNPQAKGGVTTPKDLAEQLFDAWLVQCKGDGQETGRQVLVFLSKAIAYTAASLTKDEKVRLALLKSVADSIATAPRP